MIPLSKIITISITGEHLDLVKAYAKSVELNGVSRVYKDKARRKKFLRENQLTGQAGEYGACMALYDFEKYVEKQEQEVKKGEGDDGTDIVGTRIPVDVKSSNVKTGLDQWSRILYGRHLMVSNAEYSPNMIYVASVIPNTPSHDDDEIIVYVVGWVWGRDIPFKMWRERPTDEFPMGEEKEGFRMKYGALKPLDMMDWASLLDNPYSGGVAMSNGPVLLGA